MKRHRECLCTFTMSPMHTIVKSTGTIAELTSSLTFSTTFVEMDIKGLKQQAGQLEEEAEADDAAAAAAKLLEKKHDEEADAAINADDEPAADAAMTAAEQAAKEAADKKALASAKLQALR